LNIKINGVTYTIDLKSWTQSREDFVNVKRKIKREKLSVAMWNDSGKTNKENLPQSAASIENGKWFMCIVIVFTAYFAHHLVKWIS